MSIVRLIVATRSSGPPASGEIIKEMPGSVASGTTYISVRTYFTSSVCPMRFLFYEVHYYELL